MMQEYIKDTVLVGIIKSVKTNCHDVKVLLAKLHYKWSEYSMTAFHFLLDSQVYSLVDIKMLRIFP